MLFPWIVLASVNGARAANQMEKRMEDTMEIGITWWLIAFVKLPTPINFHTMMP